MPLKPNDHRVAEILRKAGLVDEMQLRSALARLEQWGGRLSGVLSDMGMVDGEQVAEALAKAMKLPTVHLGMTPRDGGALARLDEAYCTEHGLFPISLHNRVMTLAMADPTELSVVDHVTARIGGRVSVVVASEAEIASAIARHYRGGKGAPGTNLARRAFTSDIPAMNGIDFEMGETSADLPSKPSAPRRRSPRDRGPPSANTLLDEMMHTPRKKGAAEPGFTEAELTRLEAARVNQEKASAIFRALEDLLTEKGYR